MRLAIKKKTKTVQAWQLGSGSKMEEELISQRKIIFHPPANYEIFAQEASNGTGEFAIAGDYIKIDGSGFPYPNTKTFFEANHTQVGECLYEQKAKPLSVWLLGDPEDKIITFLRQHKGLVIDAQNLDRCFSAPLFGAVLSAKADAALVIYEVKREASGRITDVDYNLVAKTEFDATYEIIASC